MFFGALHIQIYFRPLFISRYVTSQCRNLWCWANEHHLQRHFSEGQNVAKYWKLPKKVFKLVDKQGLKLPLKFWIWLSTFKCFRKARRVKINSTAWPLKFKAKVIFAALELAKKTINIILLDYIKRKNINEILSRLLKKNVLTFVFWKRFPGSFPRWS